MGKKACVLCDLPLDGAEALRRSEDPHWRARQIYFPPVYVPDRGPLHIECGLRQHVLGYDRNRVPQLIANIPDGCDLCDVVDVKAREVALNPGCYEEPKVGHLLCHIREGNLSYDERGNLMVIPRSPPVDDEAKEILKSLEVSEEAAAVAGKELVRPLGEERDDEE